MSDSYRQGVLKAEEMVLEGLGAVLADIEYELYKTESGTSDYHRGMRDKIEWFRLKVKLFLEENKKEYT